MNELNWGQYWANPGLQTQQHFNAMQPAPHYEIIKVNGEASAKSFRMGPNSTALLLDETAPIVWYAQTDGTGYLTVTPFDVSPHKAQPPVDVNDLYNRVAKIEEYLTNVQQSNSTNTKPRKQQQQQRQQQQSNTTATVDISQSN